MHDDTSTRQSSKAEMNDAVDSPVGPHFRKTVFYVLIENVFAGLTVCFNAIKRLAKKFDFLWNYPTMCVSEIEKSTRVAHQYSSDLDDEDPAEEIQHL